MSIKSFPMKKDSSNNSGTLVPGLGRLPYPAYHGDEPYIFVSYSHKDSDKVFKEIKRLNEDGYRVWYDEGIAPGNEWTDEIASALENCSLFVVFLTKNSVMSPNVKNEIDFAIDEKIPAIGIYLEECSLQGGLKLRFKNKQAILKYTMDDEEYVYRYNKAFARLVLEESTDSDEEDADFESVRAEEEKRRKKELEKRRLEELKREKRKKLIKGVSIGAAALVLAVGIFSLVKFVILPANQNASDADSSDGYVYVKSVDDTNDNVPAAEPDSSKDYVPKGTATITTTDGKTLTAIANSLTMYADHVESGVSAAYPYMGLDNALPDDYSSDTSYKGENMKYFADMTSVERKSNALVVTDIDDNQTDITPPDTAELWYLGEANGLEPESVLLSSVKSISFDRDTTPDFEVRYARVSTTKESFLSPIAYVWFNINLSNSGIPSMKLSKELTTYADQPVTVQNMKKFTVTKNGSSGSAFSAPESIECTAELRNGDDVSFTMAGYYSFYAMGHNGALKEPSREDLKEIDFYPE